MKKRATITLIVAETGIISPRCSAMGQRREQPKENKKRTTLLGFLCRQFIRNIEH